MNITATNNYTMPKEHTIPDTPFTVDLFSDFVTDIFQLHTPLYRKCVRNIWTSLP